jgi:uncharacterized membrane protein
MNADDRLPHRLRVAGWLVGSGVLVQAATLFSDRPLAFIVFVGLGLTLVGAGALLFLWSVVRAS